MLKTWYSEQKCYFELNMSFRRLEFRQKTHVRGFAYFPKIPETDRCGASYFKSQMDKFTYFYFQKKLVAVKIITGKLSETCYCFLNFPCARDQSIRTRGRPVYSYNYSEIFTEWGKWTFIEEKKTK